MTRNRALLAGLVASASVLQAQPAVRPDVDPQVAGIVAGISQERLARTVAALAGFGTRNTLSDASSATRGIGAARQWIFDELTKASPRLQVGFDTYRVARQGRITRDVELRNIVALLSGKSPRRIKESAVT